MGSLARTALQSSINFLSSSLRAPDKQLSGWGAEGKAGSGPSKLTTLFPPLPAFFPPAAVAQSLGWWPESVSNKPLLSPLRPQPQLQLPLLSARGLCQPGHIPLQRISTMIEKCLSTAGLKMKFLPISIISPSQAKKWKTTRLIKNEKEIWVFLN